MTYARLLPCSLIHSLPRLLMRPRPPPPQVNAPNMKNILPELFKENLVRGR